MNVHRRIAAGVVCSLGLVAWGCSGEDVESGVKNTGQAVENAGKKIESSAEGIGKKIDEAGAKAKETMHNLKEKAVRRGQG